jgi:transcriptional regulator with XRE-family HTH domain
MAGRDQTDVATEVGITQSYLSELERGTRNPSPPVLARLAEVLGCNTEDLMPARPTAGRVA